MTRTYNIQGMSCSGCVANVKKQLAEISDIEQADVQLQAPQATITMKDEIPLSKLQEALSKAGRYIISPANA